jgi:hypothetical protein
MWSGKEPNPERSSISEFFSFYSPIQSIGRETASGDMPGNFPKNLRLLAISGEHFFIPKGEISSLMGLQ